MLQLGLSKVEKKVHMAGIIRHHKLLEMVAEQGVEFHSTVLNLCRAYSEFRPVHGDGECFYRSFIFSLCRQVFYSKGLIIFGVRDSMQTLTTRMDSLVASQPSASTQGRLPAQPEVHPKPNSKLMLGDRTKPMTQGVVARGGGTQQPRGRGGPISRRDVRFGGRRRRSESHSGTSQRIWGPIDRLDQTDDTTVAQKAISVSSIFRVLCLRLD
ncbi:unnamed protein product [Miscanthus lutarioriparius]|uniref:Ubiquitinyl hydrolase 1 n=1 Tax=Miscanthus lutarioriparius TaxID=422564 RepID=A0A811MHZ8_9POAL|nr:unnamed protein product [Miscanthus lutarioriparius]